MAEGKWHLLPPLLNFTISFGIGHIFVVALLLLFWFTSIWEVNTRNDEIGAIPGFLARWSTQVVLTITVIVMLI